MQSFKIDNFKNEFPDKNFPEVVSLNAQELDIFQTKLKDKFAIDNSNDLLSLVEKVSNSGEIIDKFNADDSSFILSDALSSLGIKSEEYVYINWYRFDDIDKIKLTALSMFFDYIWYPGSDDIDIFDESLTWVVSVRHDGAFSVSK